MHLQDHIHQGEQHLARIWKTAILRGSFAIVFGIVALAWPGIGLATLIALFAAAALLSGFTSILGALRGPVARERRVWLLLDGLITVGAGLLVLIWPDLSARALLFVIASTAVASGVAAFALGTVALPSRRGRSLLPMLWGVASVAFGVAMFAHPGAGAVALVSLVAAFAIVTGAIQIAYALELRRATRDVARALHPQRSTASTRPVAQA
jgi:uncharacterized membrane protein HdeD (DUF308 family)